MDTGKDIEKICDIDLEIRLHVDKDVKIEMDIDKDLKTEIERVLSIRKRGRTRERDSVSNRDLKIEKDLNNINTDEDLVINADANIDI